MELTHEELIQLKELKGRRKVTTEDAPMLKSIYQRLNPRYDFCVTCAETLAAEAKSLIAYAEKQIGESLSEYGNEEVEASEIEENKNIDGLNGVNIEAVIVDEAVDFISDQHKAAIGDKVVLPRRGISQLSNKKLVKYVFQEKGVQLDEETARGELLKQAKEVLKNE